MGPAGTARTLASARSSWDALQRFVRYPDRLLNPPRRPEDLLPQHIHGYEAARRGTIAAAGLTIWINDYCTGNNRADGIPPVDGRPWRLTTRQFRRTLAWFIPRQPGGSIAGAIAYRHQAIGMFEGYAGTSDSGFRAEVESEQALARGEHLLAMIDRHEHTSLTGPQPPKPPADSTT